MATKWTPGPLFVVRQNEPPHIWIVQNPDTWFQRTAAIPAYTDRLEEQEANAQLYAAAPDLYAALELLVKRCGPMAEDGKIANAALAKARGEA